VIFESFERKEKYRAANFIVDFPFTTGCMTCGEIRPLYECPFLWICCEEHSVCGL